MSVGSSVVAGTFGDSFTRWLRRVRPQARADQYCHHHFTEQENAWSEVAGAVCQYFRRAHDDAVRRIQRLIGTSLHPAGVDPAADHGYPHGLPLVTLQGFFGEVLAGMCAEHAAPSGHADWEVPVFLFRTHMVAFQQLEREPQTHDMPASIPGRTGDDCLGFRRDGDGRIIAFLYCESKCTLDHDSSLIVDAHEKASAGAVVDILQLIEVLLDVGTPEALAWVDALRILRSQLLGDPSSITRHDAVIYVHQRAPIQEQSWIPTERPHAKYTAGRPLDTFEIRLPNVSSRIGAVYAPEVWR